MLHHVSFAVRDPHHVARVVAELWHGKVMPFPGHAGSFIALAMDAHGTAIEFLPKGSVLKPAASGESSEWDQEPNSTGYTATHVNMAVPISEAEIYAIASREGWRAVRSGRQGLLELIEFWIENEIMLELMPPNLMEGYQPLVQPESLKAIFNLE
ncbi:MAG TPA: hypothetical protein V6C78_11245 [Crinalium sp.]|jgi:hypothetical protein